MEAVNEYSPMQIYVTEVAVDEGGRTSAKNHRATAVAAVKQGEKTYSSSSVPLEAGGRPTSVRL